MAANPDCCWQANCAGQRASPLGNISQQVGSYKETLQLIFVSAYKRYVWAYAAGAHEDIKAVVWDFCESRAGANAKAFLDKQTLIGRGHGRFTIY